jgi:hypothetical protein
MLVKAYLCSGLDSRDNCQPSPHYNDARDSTEGPNVLIFRSLLDSQTLNLCPMSKFMYFAAHIGRMGSVSKRRSFQKIVAIAEPKHA